jgi:hypothetical protein
MKVILGRDCGFEDEPSQESLGKNLLIKK